jgi:ABC-type branched-subunit amino acid transport system ATPase component
VVDSLDLDMAAGEIVGLIGSIGAGKTTTVECGLARSTGYRVDTAPKIYGLASLATSSARSKGRVAP